MCRGKIFGRKSLYFLLKRIGGSHSIMILMVINIFYFPLGYHLLSGNPSALVVTADATLCYLKFEYCHVQFCYIFSAIISVLSCGIFVDVVLFCLEDVVVRQTPTTGFLCPCDIPSDYDLVKCWLMLFKVLICWKYQLVGTNFQ